MVAGFLVGGLARSRGQTAINSFLPSNDPSVAELNDVGTLFGGDPIVVLLESDRPRDLLDEKNIISLIGLEGRLVGQPDVAAVYGPGTLLNQIARQAQDLLAELAGRRDGDASRAQALALQQGKSPAEAANAKAIAPAPAWRRDAGRHVRHAGHRSGPVSLVGGRYLSVTDYRGTRVTDCRSRV